ncbi:unnamed protein product [Arctogadus glacialis]
MRSHLFSCFQAGEVQLFPRAMRSPTAEPFAINVDVHCLCIRTIGQGKAPLVPCRRHRDRQSFMQRPKNTRDIKNQHLLEMWCINLNLEQARPVTQRL